MPRGAGFQRTPHRFVAWQCNRIGAGGWGRRGRFLRPFRRVGLPPIPDPELQARMIGRHINRRALIPSQSAQKDFCSAPVPTASNDMVAACGRRTAREALDNYFRMTKYKAGEYLFPGGRNPDRPLGTRQYTRLVSK